MPSNPSRDDERKADLIARVRASHTQLERALAALDPAQLEAEGTVGGWSVKATLGHITWWEQVALHALTGEPDEDILPGEEWDIDRANARLFERNRSRPLGDVLADFERSSIALLRAVEAMPAARLDEPSPYGGPLADLIAGNTYEHYDEHASAIAAAFNLP